MRIYTVYNVIIDNDQAKDARTRLGLSQGKVASSVGLNRTYLSLFENGQYLLPDADLQKLRAYYTDMGIEFSDGQLLDHQDFDAPGPAAGPNEPQRGVRIMDGFAVPLNADTDEVESLLAEYADNKAEISRLCQYDIRKHHTDEPFLFGDPEIDETAVEKCTREVLVLMARNYYLVERLQGHMPDVENLKPFDVGLSTTGEFVGSALGV